MISIAIICIIPDENQILFYYSISSYNYKIFFIVDDENYDLSTYKNTYKSLNFIQITDKECKSNNFINSNFCIKKNPSGWDKVLYYFCKINNEFDFVWIIEDDVLVPTINTIQNIDEKYSHYNSDLLSSSNDRNLDFFNNSWNWKHAKGKIKLPWFKSMVCAVRLSKKLLKVIDDYVNENKELFFIEIMFNTLCFHNKLRQFRTPELKNILYRYKWKLSDIDKNFLYHPIKDKNTMKQFTDYFK